MELGHFCRAEFEKREISRFFTGELFVLVAGLILPLSDFQPHNVLRRSRNEAHCSPSIQPSLGRGIVEPYQGILLNLLGSWKPFGELTFTVTMLKFRPNGATKRFDSIDCNHVLMVTHTRQMSNGKYKYPPTF